MKHKVNINKIANNIMRKHADLISDVSKYVAPNHKMLDNYKLANITFNNKIPLVCQVANTPEQQELGLQKHAKLLSHCGMVFPFDPPRRASFHMADVNFPIDIIFVGSDNRVTKIVSDIEPGAKNVWSMPHLAMVVEAVGGFCSDNDIHVGSMVDLSYANEKTAQESFPKYPRKDINPKMLPVDQRPDRFLDPKYLSQTPDGKPLTPIQSDPEHWELTDGPMFRHDQEDNEDLNPEAVPPIRSS